LCTGITTLSVGSLEAGDIIGSRQIVREGLGPHVQAKARKTLI
jgi:hypothetical protein